MAAQVLLNLLTNAIKVSGDGVVSLAVQIIPVPEALLSKVSSSIQSSSMMMLDVVRATAR